MIFSCVVRERRRSVLWLKSLLRLLLIDPQPGGCRDLFQEAKHIADMAEATRIYGKRIEASIETVNQAAELRIAAETLLGQMLAQTPKNEGGRPLKTGNAEEPVSEPTLSYIGVSKRLSARSQQLAALPVEQPLAHQREAAHLPLQFLTERNLRRSEKSLNQRPFAAHRHGGKAFKPFALGHLRLCI